MNPKAAAVVAVLALVVLFACSGCSVVVVGHATVTATQSK
jgi:hypothetical protein